MLLQPLKIARKVARDRPLRDRPTPKTRSDGREASYDAKGVDAPRTYIKAGQQPDMGVMNARTSDLRLLRPMYMDRRVQVTGHLIAWLGFERCVDMSGPGQRRAHHDRSCERSIMGILLHSAGSIRALDALCNDVCVSRLCTAPFKSKVEATLAPIFIHIATGRGEFLRRL